MDGGRPAFQSQLIVAESVAIFAAPVARADALTNAAALWKFDGASSGFVTNANQILDFSGNGHNATGMTNPGDTNIFVGGIDGRAEGVSGAASN